MSELGNVLATLTAEQVREEARELERHARRLRVMADALDGTAPDSDAPPDATVKEESAAASKRPAAHRGRAKPGPRNKRPAILQVVQSRHEPWSPRQIYQALLDRGLVDPATSSQSVRVAIHRMAELGELHKIADGLYGPPAPNGVDPLIPVGGES